MLKHHYQHFLSNNKNVQHYACHSHHYWPDVTRQAMLDYWDDSARLVDDKWGYFFEEKVPALQTHIASILGTGQPEQVVFAPNTHELLFRVISGLDLSAELTIVTTDSEFHSFNRQINRLDELKNIHVIKVPVQPLHSFESRFADAVQYNDPHLVFCSQVFFNSGFAVQSIDKIIASVENPDTVIMIDGYHAFCAMPVDISAHRNRIFYLAGGYKYAQGGEGVCFMHVPKGFLSRPLYTGWYAEFGELQKFKSRKVDYATNGFHFAGSTMDYSGIYRQLAVFNLWQTENISIAAIHAHVQTLQQAFLSHLESLQQTVLTKANLLLIAPEQHGHFLTFEFEKNEQAASLHQFLKSHHIETDYRGTRLRFGFAPYHEVADINLSCLENYHD
ncbi:aminotransferase class V-fold PLP-dependent enzyme [Planctobacterium marinum]|uniref:Aminotransferase class V domain-containing protein n=1 Tax=Planctobacterium marinum TaxID=1631968 RepID=A0AA48I2E3_9ALTE|nr:hypothetical protein MACH26_01860 [Planctobacterium marinum]